MSKPKIQKLDLLNQIFWEFNHLDLICYLVFSIWH